jgi:hypothetical protein
VLEQLVRERVHAELVALVDRELDRALERLASRNGARVAEVVSPMGDIANERQARVAELVSPIGHIPANEAQARVAEVGAVVPIANEAQVVDAMGPVDPTPANEAQAREPTGTTVPTTSTCSSCGREPRLPGRTIGARCKAAGDATRARARRRERRTAAATAGDDGPRPAGIAQPD